MAEVGESGSPVARTSVVRLEFGAGVSTSGYLEKIVGIWGHQRHAGEEAAGVMNRAPPPCGETHPRERNKPFGGKDCPGDQHLAPNCREAQGLLTTTASGEEGAHRLPRPPSFSEPPSPLPATLTRGGGLFPQITASAGLHASTAGKLCSGPTQVFCSPFRVWGQFFQTVRGLPAPFGATLPLPPLELQKGTPTGKEV